jgi:hypothetical protein
VPRRASFSAATARSYRIVLSGIFAGISAAAVMSVGVALVTTFSLPACNLKESEGGTCPTNIANQGSGTTPCGDSTCSAGTYCAIDGGDGCSNGCTATAQCPFGNYCDMSKPVPDLVGNMIGTCTPPTLEQQQGACPDDGGNDASSSSSKDAGK